MCSGFKVRKKKASNAFVNFLRKNDERGLKQRMYVFHL